MYFLFFNLYFFIQYESETFLDFIKDICAKDKNRKIILDINSKDNNAENINLIKKQNIDYKNKIDELNIKIKQLEWELKVKNNIIDEYNKIKELKNISKDKNISNDNIYINRIKELEKEIEKYKNYCLLPGEKLISIKIISNDQTLEFNTFSKITDNFEKLESSLYKHYPKYKETENFFLVNGAKVNKHKTFEENKIKDNDILTLKVYDENDL